MAVINLVTKERYDLPPLSIKSYDDMNIKGFAAGIGFDLQALPYFGYHGVVVSGCWNNDGDILFTIGRRRMRMYVYTLKTCEMRKLDRGDKYSTVMRMHLCSLFSIRRAYFIKDLHSLMYDVSFASKEGRKRGIDDQLGTTCEVELETTTHQSVNHHQLILRLNSFEIN
ncbi:hypothetical protein QVD17_37203 [Tagetes erecta]|uniref:Uncharacterized protein n=1 Tax=Tagetes erecta TaxID=13708 RepID=A0AAD8K035_TARER|nr:hypothetical protein QVD17_37203 [Tagetes erecta]